MEMCKCFSHSEWTAVGDRKVFRHDVVSAQLPSSNLEKQCESDCTSSLGILYAKIEAKLKETKQNQLQVKQSKNTNIQGNGFKFIFWRLLHTPFVGPSPHRTTGVFHPPTMSFQLRAGTQWLRIYHFQRRKLTGYAEMWVCICCASTSQQCSTAAFLTCKMLALFLKLRVSIFLQTFVLRHSLLDRKELLWNQRLARMWDALPICSALPFLSVCVREDVQDLPLQVLHLLYICCVLQFHFQEVPSAEFTLQVLYGANTPANRRDASRHTQVQTEEK